MKKKKTKTMLKAREVFNLWLKKNCKKGEILFTWQDPFEFKVVKSTAVFTYKLKK